LLTQLVLLNVDIQAPMLPSPCPSKNFSRKLAQCATSQGTLTHSSHRYVHMSPRPTIPSIHLTAAVTDDGRMTY